eukprot:Protomagalhaensia_wolfi_Nauph_80__5283@NODE_570_length_2273_cov_537_094897_g426_i0_p3_GENE_NODE_570_length_2273_cov_537_094897_g426_i0NODE_570_length_2273_cov_537_094897_g426_i0_p3_ORF_typecomplete_len175_score30_99RNA_pol_Rpc34/PF05158_12/0_00079RNA_pol_Rpc34/PF05158_12/7_3_NODE_570_length_2273_cov_537_094897_g426_i010391563
MSLIHLTHSDSLIELNAFNQSFSFQDLNEQDLEKVFRTLVLDQMLISTVHPQTGEVVYSTAAWPDLDEFERIPCVSCPMLQTCQVEDLDRFDSIMLRQALTATDKQKEAKMLRQGLQGNSAITAASGKGIDIPFSSKVTPSSCPYLSQWLSLGGYEPLIPKPAEQPTNEANAPG